MYGINGPIYDARTTRYLLAHLLDKIGVIRIGEIDAEKTSDPGPCVHVDAAERPIDNFEIEGLDQAVGDEKIKPEVPSIYSKIASAEYEIRVSKSLGKTAEGLREVEGLFDTVKHVRAVGEEPLKAHSVHMTAQIRKVLRSPRGTC